MPKSEIPTVVWGLEPRHPINENERVGDVAFLSEFVDDCSVRTVVSAEQSLTEEVRWLLD